jgi:serine/threonine protein kinase
MNTGMEMYASPELIDVIRDANPRRLQSIDRFKNDVFALGATIIELGLLKPLNKIVTEDKMYDPNQMKIYLKHFENEYSSNKLLVSLVKVMVKANPQERPTFLGNDYAKFIKKNKLKMLMCQI